MNEAARKTRVLIVDDSVVMRRILSEVVAQDSELEVAGYAANGQIALNLLEQVSPDVITLDVEMPVMDGLATLKAMRAQRCYIPVIMFSTLTERGAEATIESLALGAGDYVAKPTELHGYAAARDRIRDALIPRIKAISRNQPNRPTPAQTTGSPAWRCRNKIAGRIDVLAIGCSTGGPNALAQLLPTLPGDFSVPVLIVQHMPPAFTQLLAQRLSTVCPLPVRESAGGERLQPGTIWIAPGGFHMAVQGNRGGRQLIINQEPTENSCRPSVDVLFRSLIPVFAGHVLAVVLTGMGQDGLRGCQALADAGAQILVQDEATSVVWGMPGFVAKAGLADAVVPLPELGARIVERVTATNFNLFSPREASRVAS